MPEPTPDHTPGPPPWAALLTEDWAATLVGLLLLVLVLTGVIPTGLVP
jgi:hypothetical protein